MSSVIEEVRERCCGLDVHKKTVTACVLTPDDRQIRTFGTTHGELLALADWLAELRVATVGMESTGVFWKPIYNLLEHEFELVVANARHIKAVPGRKTDIKDSEWIAGLLMHGLLKPSFIPDRPQRELRELVRYRRRVVQNKAQIANQMHKVLEGGNIKLASVATDILGVSGREMLRALIAGEKDSSVLAELARGLLRKKLEELRLALHGTVGRHQQFMLGVLLQSLEMYETQIANLDKEVARRFAPLEETINRLDSIPGVGRRAAEDIIAEIGTDMSRFPSAKHLASWAKISPGNYQSAGKRRSGFTGRGSPWLSSILTEVAQAAARTKDTYLSARYRRLAARRGRKRAITAIAHTVLKIIYHLLRHGTEYHDLGADYFDQRDKRYIVRRSVKRLERLGYRVTIEAA